MSEKLNTPTPENNTPKTPKSIAQFLEEKTRLLHEAAIQEKAMEDQFKKLVTVMFTDIKGSTSFYEKHGDIEGRMMVEQHNKLLFPIVEEVGGEIIKTVGDAIMAKYPSPADGVRAAVKMQQVLREYRSNTKTAYDIHVRIGLHYGYGMVEHNDIFGDVVNCAARVESMADGDEIYISGDVYTEIKNEDDIIVRFKEETKVKGKEELVKIYRVIWNEQDLMEEEAELTKTGTRRASRRGAQEVIDLQMNRVGDVIKLSAVEKTRGQQKTVSQYEESNVSAQEVQALCQKVTALLNRANKRGKISKEILKQLKEVGAMLYDKILTPDAKKVLQKSTADELTLHIDDQLVQIPWELMYDGQEFLGLRFSMGRIVATKQKVSDSKSRRIGHPLRMLVLADPRGDLPSSTEEGRELRNLLDTFGQSVSVHLKTGEIAREFVEQKIRNFDIVHYAGHADYNPENPSDSGWLVRDGKVTSQDINRMGGGKPMPALVFSNACQSGQTEEWNLGEYYEQEIYGLANAFLLAGVQHYVGTFWDILDAPSQHFSHAFYKALMDGESIGSSVKAARMALIQRYGEENIVWASYMLYGDPTFVYHQSGAQVIDMPETGASDMQQAVGAEMPSGALRHGSAEAMRVPMAGAPASGKSFTNALIAVGLAVILALGAFIYLKGGAGKMADDGSAAAQGYGYLKAGDYDKAKEDFTRLASDDDTRVKGHEGLAALAFAQGDYQTASDEAQQALKEDPANAYAKVILGNIAFNQGDLPAAEQNYRQATESSGGEVWQKSEAFNRLGRVYAAKGDNGQALASYGQAIQTDPANAEAYANQGKAFEKAGQFDKAIGSYQQGAQANPADAMTGRLLANALASQSVRGNQEKMDAMRQQVSSLVERYKQGKAEAAKQATDEWTSPSLDITFIDFANKGAATLREGENEYLLLKVIDRLQTSGRVKVVEREMIQDLLTELNLSSSDLADKDAALKLGKVVGARVISTGSLIRHREEVQVSLRMIETETSRIPVSVTETFDGAAKADDIAEKVAAKILEKLPGEFPIRGLALEVKGDEATLNIGAAQGVTKGMKLAVIDDSEKIMSGDKELGRKKVKVGEIEIVQVDEKFSIGKRIDGKVEKGRKVAEGGQ